MAWTWTDWRLFAVHGPQGRLRGLIFGANATVQTPSDHIGMRAG